jgi:hypothetical protein
MSTIVQKNAGYGGGLDGIYFPQGNNHLRVREANGRILSEDELWGDCPILNYFLNPSFALLDDECFVGYDATNDWTLTQATAGSAAISTTVPGCLLMNSGDTTAHHGAQIQKKVAAFIPAAGKDFWFECFCQPGFLTGEFFFGLAAVDTTIIASGAMSTNNRIGWTGVAGDGVMQFDSDKAGTSQQSTGATLSTSAMTAFGFKYDGTADTLQQYINGVATGSAIATTYIPKLVIYPSFVCQNQATDQVTLAIGGYRAFQLR